MKKKLIIGLSIALFLVAFVVIIIISLPPKKTTNSNTTPKKSESTENHTHSWSEWITEKDPTCTSNGIKYRTCECGEIEDISFAALEHNFGDWVIEVNPKCNEEGIKAHVCVRCNLKETQKIDALLHTEGDWIINNFQKQFLCIYCKEILRIEEISISYELNIENSVVTSIGNCNDNEIVIPSTASIIGKQAFKYEPIVSAILPDSVIRIEEKAFYQCSNLQFVHFGINLINIESKAFFKCSSIVDLHLPSSLQTIGEYAFAYCSSLENLYIENSIDKIEMSAFQDCIKLTNIYFNGTIEEWNAIEKGIKWDLGTPEYTVYCTDGNIQK